MVKTRSMHRNEVVELEEKDNALQHQVFPSTGNELLALRNHSTDAAKTNDAESRLPPPMGERQSLRAPSTSGAKSKTSSSSSLEARKKRLVLEAAKEKSRIQLELIDKTLEADLAELEVEYSPHFENVSHKNSEVESWIDKSQNKQRKEQQTRDQENYLGELRPPAAITGTSDETVKLLASALKDIALNSANVRSNATLLSRISTPKDLPEFSGDPMEWLQFKQAYEESTQVCGFTPKENLWRLRKCLRGPAKNAGRNSHKSHAVLLLSENKYDICQFCNKEKHTLPACQKFKKALCKVRWYHVKRRRLCFKCLLSHHNRENCAAPACDKEECGGAHHSLLHYRLKNREVTRVDTQQRSQVSESVPETSPLHETVANVSSRDSTVLLKVVRVNVHGPRGVFSVNALLDDGSTISLISADLAVRAVLRGRHETLRMCGAWNSELVCESTVMTVEVFGYDDKPYKINLRSVKELNLPLQNVSSVDFDKYANLRLIKDKLLCNSQLKPEMLIGQDNFHLLTPIEVCLGNQNEPSATLTPLGWCVHGVVRMPRETLMPHSALTIAAANPDSNSSHTTDSELMMRELLDEVRRSFAIDTLGVAGKPRQNADDERAIAQLERSATLVACRWQVGLPWRDENCTMPDAYPGALKRMKGIETKMCKNVGFATRYRERVNHLLENDYAKELTENSISLASSRIWYLPHFGVDNPNKKKLRLVFDAASKVNGCWLNDYLLTGPDLLLPLFGIMLRFRENQIAVMGDIKDMSLRVKIRAEDQHALRFFWRNNTSEKMKTYTMTSLIFGANCSPFVAQYVKNKNARRFESSMPAAVDAICNSHYMDDYVDSLPDEASAIAMVSEVNVEASEVENIVNSQPLMHVSVEPDDAESLTPNHFLLGSSSNLPVMGSFDDSDLTLRKQWRKAQRLADMYWQRWVKEILPDLLPRKRWQGEQEPLQVGDLVLIVDPNSSRNTWPRGRVSQVFPGKDGRVRLVEVKTATGTWRRGAARLAPISK